MPDKTPPPPAVITEDDRTGTSVETLKRAILDNLYYIVAKLPQGATEIDYFTAVAYTVRDRILAQWIKTLESYARKELRVVCYLSAEFLMGPYLANNILNLGLDTPFRQAIKELGLDLDRIIASESEPGLGNGGLGRLAACYLDSLATLSVPAIGYGIRYEFGMFHQQIRDGWQVEMTDYWLRYGNPWEIRRSQASVEVGFRGHTESWTDDQGKYRVRWVPQIVVKGVPYDTPIVGYRSGEVNDLVCGSQRRQSRSTLSASTAAIIRVPSPPRFSRRTSPRSCIPMMKRYKAKNCGCSSNISSLHAHYRT